MVVILNLQMAFSYPIFAEHIHIANLPHVGVLLGKQQVRTAIKSGKSYQKRFAMNISALIPTGIN